MNNKRTFYKISYENNYVSIEFLEDEMHEIYGRLANIYIAKNDYISFETIFWFFSLKLDIKEREKLYQKYILEQSHYAHEEMASAFQTIFNNNTENIPILLKALKNIPGYLEDDDFKYPYVRKIIYAIGAQPQPESLLALEKLASETNDTEIKKLALHQLEKRKELGRWEYEKNR